MFDFLPYAGSYMTQLSLFRDQNSFLMFLNQLDGKDLNQDLISPNGKIFSKSLETLFNVEFIQNNIQKLRIQNRQVILKPVNETTFTIFHKFDSDTKSSAAALKIIMHDHELKKADMLFQDRSSHLIVDLLNKCWLIAYYYYNSSNYVVHEVEKSANHLHGQAYSCEGHYNNTKK